MAGSTSGPLEGLRILDLSTVIMGPYASQLLADMGADVIKIESDRGDPLRYYKPQKSETMSGMFLSVHRNKRSVVLDLKSEAGLSAFYTLVTQSDVVLHNLRPKVAKRLGIEFEILKTHNPSIVVCKAYGYGEEGPYADRPAYDDVIQAASGMSDLFRKVGGEPKYVPSVIGDKIAGLMISNAVLAASYDRAVRNVSIEVEVPMFESMVTFNLVENLSANTFEPPLSPMGWSRNISPMRKPFRTQDDYMCVLPYSDQNWKDFLQFVGRAEVLDDPRFSTLAERTENIEILYRVIEEVAPQHTNAEWLDFCEKHDIPAAAVISLDDMWEDPQVKAVNLYSEAEHPTEGRYRVWRSPVRFLGKPWRLNRHAPNLGEHTEEVLRDAGLSEAEIQKTVQR